MTKWDYGATLAASLAHLLVYQQDAVGLTLFDSEVRDRLPVSSSRASLYFLADTIESHAPQNISDVKFFQHLASSIPRRGMVVMISDLLADMDDIIRGLQRLRYGQHDVLVLHVLDHDELEFPFADRTLFEGLEAADRNVLIDPQSLRGSYLEAVRGFIRRLRGVCLDHRIDYALISTADPIDMALTTFLATRMRRQRART
jgi:uncharacterized protein (DUF58 family)